MFVVNMNMGIWYRKKVISFKNINQIKKKL